MYISEKDFNSIVETYFELFESVLRLEKDLRNIERCLDNVEGDNKEEVKEKNSWDCTMCNNCTCSEEKEQSKCNTHYSKVYFDMLTDFNKIIEFGKMVNKEHKENVTNKQMDSKEFDK